MGGSSSSIQEEEDISKRKLKAFGVANNCEVDIDKLKKLRCQVCHNWLVKPIYISTNGDSYCGSCITDNANTFIKCEALEIALSKFKFPCPHATCHQWFTYDGIQTHQQHCLYQEFKCKFCEGFFNNTRWLDHMIEEHSSHCEAIKIETPQANIDLTLTNAYQRIFVFNYKNIKFIVELRVANKTLSCQIYEEPRAKEEIPYKMSLLSNDNRSNYEGQYVESFKAFITEDNSDTINVPVEEGIGATVSLIFASHKTTKIADCPICMETLTDMITCCNNGHWLCKNCTPMVNSCPFCRTDITGLVELSKIFPGMIVQCPFATLGCPQVETRDAIESHTMTCPYKRVKCVICKECVAQNKMNCHLKNTHSVTINTSVCLNNLEDVFVACNQYVFRFQPKKKTEDIVSFAVQLLNEDDCKITTRFEYCIKTSIHDIMNRRALYRPSSNLSAYCEIDELMKHRGREHEIMFDCYVYPSFAKKF